MRVLDCLIEKLRVHAHHQGTPPLSPFTSSDVGPHESSLPLTLTQQELQQPGRSPCGAAPGSATSGASPSLPDQVPDAAKRAGTGAPPPVSSVRSPCGGGRKVSFTTDLADAPGPPPAPGALPAALESPRLSSMGMRELRDVMRKMHYTRCSLPAGKYADY